MKTPFFLMAYRKKNSYFAFESVIVDGYYLDGINYSPGGRKWLSGSVLS